MESSRIKPGYVINPKTGKLIRIGGPTFKKYSRVQQQRLIREADQGGYQSQQKCPPEEVWRPKTQRCIKIGGKTWKTLSETEKNQLLARADSSQGKPRESRVIRGKKSRGPTRVRKPVVPATRVLDPSRDYICTPVEKGSRDERFCIPSGASRNQISKILSRLGFNFTPDEVDRIYSSPPK